MQFNSLLSAIPRETKNFVKRCGRNNVPCDSEVEDSVEKLLMRTGMARTVYRSLCKPSVKVACKRNKWENDICETLTTDEFTSAFLNIYKVTNVAKYRSFQFRLLHRAIITNVHLNRWGLRETDLCSFCELTCESYKHLFFECNHVRRLWYSAELFKDKSNTMLSYKNIVLNQVHQRVNHVDNFICLLTKQYIYRQRCLKKDLSSFELRNHIRMTENVEKSIAFKNNRVRYHNDKWKCNY